MTIIDSKGHGKEKKNEEILLNYFRQNGFQRDDSVNINNESSKGCFCTDLIDFCSVSVKNVFLR